MIDTSPEGFITGRLNEAVVELGDIRQHLKVLSDRLGEAETCIRFYGDIQNYKAIRNANGTVFQNILSNDFSQADNDSQTNLAGRRAREYLKKYGSE